MTPHVGYTYLIKFKQTGQFYYGSRCAKGCHPDEFWMTYFTSSKIVHKMIKNHGKESFEFEIRHIFANCPKDAQAWERKVLRRMNVCARQDFLNKHNGCVPALSGWKNPFFGKKHSEETKQKMRKPKSRKSAIKRKMSDKCRENLSIKRKCVSYDQLYGELKSQEIRRKLSRRGSGNPAFGKLRPEIAGDMNPSKREDVKEKIRLAKVKNDIEKILCITCKNSFDKANFAKSHGDKCWRHERACLVCSCLFIPKYKQRQTCSGSCGYKLRSIVKNEK